MYIHVLYQEEETFPCDSHARAEPAYKEDMKLFGNVTGYIYPVRKLFFLVSFCFLFFGSNTFSDYITSHVAPSKAVPAVKLGSTALAGIARVTLT